jgi:hypothetical protein
VITYRDVLDYVGTASREEITGIHEAANARARLLRDLKTAEAAATIKVGDRVTLNGLRPKYLNGLQGEIKATDGTRATVELGKVDAVMARRYATLDGRILVPIGSLTVV